MRSPSRPAAALTLPALLIAACAISLPVTVPNMDFERAGERSLPEGWYVGKAEGFDAQIDCASAYTGSCALRLSGTGGVKERFIPVSRTVPVNQAAGHPVTLSGHIRTDDVSGWAGLWLRVDGPWGRMMSLENMSRIGPRGTTSWKRFEITLPVPPEAERIAFGVLLSGGGRAWFDDLQLSVNQSVSVPPSIVAPPRPVPSNALADDSAVTLTHTVGGPDTEVWHQEARRHLHPIRSLVSEDFTDLQFLKPLLSGKRVVQLGESGHGVAEFNWLKVRLVKFLHQEMGFDVIAFESSLYGCEVADTRVGIAPATNVMADCIFGVWHTSETIELFKYLETQRGKHAQLRLAGFDVQASGRAAKEVSALLVGRARQVSSELGKRVQVAEAKLRAGAITEPLSMLTAYRELQSQLEAMDALNRMSELAERRALVFAIQEVRSRLLYVEQLSSSDLRQRTAARDRGMADNLEFLLESAFPNQKVIVWAHNFHIAKEQPAGNATATMGTRVRDRHAGEVYTIGMYMGRGIAAQNNRKLYEVFPAKPGSLESVMAAGGWKASFVDFSPAKSKEVWWTQPIEARDWGANPQHLIPARAFDGVVYIDTVTPPDYLSSSLR
jgi:erythromycin esterase